MEQLEKKLLNKQVRLRLRLGYGSLARLLQGGRFLRPANESAMA
jgi:hypothetical protein